MAGLRIRDGNLYEPDPSLIPRDVRAVHRELRLRWRQERALARAVASWARDEGHPELRFTAETGELNGWSDPLPLARLAVALRPGDPLGRITLSAALFRYSKVAHARQELEHLAIQHRSMTGTLRARWLRNRALLFEALGDPSAAVQLLRLCLRMEPHNPAHETDFLAYAIATRQECSCVWAVRQLRHSRRAEAAKEAVLAVWHRRAAPAGRLLRTEPCLLRVVSREADLPESVLYE